MNTRLHYANLTDAELLIEARVAVYTPPSQALWSAVVGRLQQLIDEHEAVTMQLAQWEVADAQRHVKDTLDSLYQKDAG